MSNTNGNFLDFLENIYGRQATDQICKLAGMDRDEVSKACEAFTPAFLHSLMAAKGGAAAGGPDSLGKLWSSDLQKAMSDVMSQGMKTAQSFAAKDKDESAAFPFNLYADQTETLDQLYQTFMSQMAQAKLMDEVGKATGMEAGQMRKLFPVLTAYGLMPLMPPSPDDPAGWVDYLGELGRANMRQATRKLDAMPNTANAAFEGLLAGLYPKAPDPVPMEEPEDKMEELKDASLTLQTNYIKGLNSLFESYAAGFEGEKDKE